MTQKAQATKAKTNRWVYQIKKNKQTNFCTAIQINKMNKQPTEWEKILTNHIADKGLIFKMHSELIEQHTYIQIQCNLK